MKYILTWIIAYTIVLPCPDIPASDPVNPHNDVLVSVCTVYHAEERSDTLTRVFDTRAELDTFKLLFEGRQDVKEVHIDSVKAIHKLF